MKKILSAAVLIVMISAAAVAQKTDTVVVELAQTSRMVFTIKDKSDLEQLKQYDFQALFNDIIARLEKNDSVVVVVNPKPAEPVDTWNSKEFSITINDDDDDENDDYNDYWERKTRKRTQHFFNVDLGINSFLEEGKFPDEEGKAYASRPWGSWYVGLTSVQRTNFGKNFHVDWGLGVSWYNFKFQNDKTTLIKGAEEVTFQESDIEDVSFIKSKLGVTYLNASIIPMFTFGNPNPHKRWKRYNDGFRIGAGPYVGYRIGSSTKLVYKEDGDRQRDRVRDNFYLNNVRYGVRLQIGVRSADFFFNYDLNELFNEGKGPKLNAFSFGITL